MTADFGQIDQKTKICNEPDTNLTLQGLAQKERESKLKPQDVFKIFQ